MAKIVVECADPNDLGAVEMAVEQFVGKCNITFFKQHQALVKAGNSSSQRQSAKIIASELGESEDAVRNRIQRGGMQVTKHESRDKWPMCKNVNSTGYRCVLDVKTTRKNGEDVPADHGYCRIHRQEQLNRVRAIKEKAETDKTIEEFDKIPVDSEADDIWNEIVPKVKELFEEADHRVDGLFEKVHPNTLDSIKALQDDMWKIFDAIIEVSKRPGYS